MRTSAVDAIVKLRLSPGDGLSRERLQQDPTSANARVNALVPMAEVAAGNLHGAPAPKFVRQI
jgi:hypothetical protein